MESSVETSQDRVPDAQNDAGAHDEMIVPARPCVSGSDITQDVDVLVWWRDVGQVRFPHIGVMTRQFLTIPVASGTDEGLPVFLWVEVIFT